jgi:hypothetical protein
MMANNGMQNQGDQNLFMQMMMANVNAYNQNSNGMPAGGEMNAQ